MTIEQRLDELGMALNINTATLNNQYAILALKFDALLEASSEGNLAFAGRFLEKYYKKRVVVTFLERRTNTEYADPNTVFQIREKINKKLAALKKEGIKNEMLPLYNEAEIDASAMWKEAKEAAKEATKGNGKKKRGIIDIGGKNS